MAMHTVLQAVVPQINEQDGGGCQLLTGGPQIYEEHSYNVNSPFKKSLLKDEEQKRKKKMSRMEGDANSRLEDLRDMRNSINKLYTYINMLHFVRVLC